jgi:hypothetical protein
MDLIVVVVAEARQILRGKLCLAPRVVGVPFLSTALPNVCSGPSKLRKGKKKENWYIIQQKEKAAPCKC